MNEINLPESMVFLLAYALLIFMKIVCFVLGYLTIRLGYELIKSGATGAFQFSASWSGLKADLRSISPGLLFVLLGVFLIGYAIHVEKTVEVPYPGAANKVSSTVQTPSKESPPKPTMRATPP